MEKDIVSVEISREDRRKLKTLASLEAQTIPEWLNWMIGKAYESKIYSKHASK